MGDSQKHLFESFLKQVQMIRKWDVLLFSLILFRRILVIIDTIALATEIETKKAVRTILAVITKYTFATIIEILWKETSITPMHIDDLITILRIVRLIKITAIFWTISLITIEQIFSCNRRDDEIAILQITGMKRVVTVYEITSQGCRKRHTMDEISELIEKCPRKIRIDSVV